MNLSSLIRWPGNFEKSGPDNLNMFLNKLKIIPFYLSVDLNTKNYF